MNKQEIRIDKFTSEYIKDFNGARAAVDAGYSKRTAAQQAARLLTKVNVQNLIQEKQKRIIEKDHIDAAYIKEQAHKLYLQCSGQEAINKTVVVDGRAIEMEVREFNGTAANKAIENLGKHVDIQAFKEQVKVEGEIDMVSPLLAARKRLENK